MKNFMGFLFNTFILLVQDKAKSQQQYFSLLKFITQRHRKNINKEYKIIFIQVNKFKNSGPKKWNQDYHCMLLFLVLLISQI